ncbi:MAG: M24 family metallopeptidase [Firmicutes bacterium]|nr:M24 family metallopeptidase [Bacillota bacterium]
MIEYAPSLTFGPGFSDAQRRLDAAQLRQERAERMRAVMRAHQVPALLASGAAAGRYLTGLTGAEFASQLWYVLFFAESDPVVFAHAGYITRGAQEAPWVKDWRLARAWLGGIAGPEATRVEAKLFAKDLQAVLHERGLAQEPLAVSGFDNAALNALQEAGLQTVGGRDLLLEAASIKTPEEIRCITLAVTVAETAWPPFMQALRGGGPEQAAVLAGMQRLAALGAEPRMGIRSGPLTFERGQKETQRIVRPGELLYGQLCGTSFLGYRVCLYRTFVVGREPSPVERDLYQRLYDRLHAAIAELRPGQTTADAARHFPPASTWGYRDEAEVLTIEIGHGVGLNQYEPPVINRQWSLPYPQPLLENMVVAMEGREGSPQVGGVRLERMVWISAQGPRLLDRFPAEAIQTIPLF